ncbi:adenine nucleotide transporter BT1, chloroplastic/mitochondrial-like [Morus notabilis]|nr:adenine nucleotide transporter BT1, chloroplastic/mitochondrial-like [Morus notabilis]
MGRRKSTDVEHGNKDVTFSSCVINIHQLSSDERSYSTGGLFASVGQVGMEFGISLNPQNPSGSRVKLPNAKSYMKYVTIHESGYQIRLAPELERGKALEVGEEKVTVKRKKGDGLKLRMKIGNDSLRRLMSGGIAGAVSRSAVAPLETIKTHLMVGSCGQSAAEVFQSIMKTEGWKGLYRGNLVNVIRVAPNKAIELFAYDTVKKYLTPKLGENNKILVPASLIAGAVAGFSSTFCTYPLELLKTRLTVQRGVYKNSLHALMKIAGEEGAAELYRGLIPSLIGVIPYAATNYFAYDTLRKAYKKAFNQDEIGNVTTLLMGSAAAVVSSCATFPLEVARKQIQAGAFSGRQYKNMLHALVSILEREGIPGLYRGLGPSCMKLVPAAGISFMCYEACKRVMIEKKELV